MSSHPRPRHVDGLQLLQCQAHLVEMENKERVEREEREERKEREERVRRRRGGGG